MKSITTLCLLLLAAGNASAQTPSAASASGERWAPFLGCWQLAEESIEGTAAASTRGALVCVTPAPNGGATMTTLVNDKPLLVETVIADGSQRPLSDPACKGWQQAEWSALAPRVYARTEVACGDQPRRVVSGMGTVVAGPVWLDIQMIESEGRKSMRVRRYRRAADQRAAAPLSTAQQIAAMPLGGKLTLPDIKEATVKLAPEVLQAAVLELGAGGYDLDGKRLIELDAAGVPDSVIDLMVAMSFPKKFVVDRAVPSAGGFGSTWGPFSMWPYYSHPYYYSSYYSPFGYGSWGYYDPYYYGTPGIIAINPGGGTDSAAEPSGNGRVVDGQGYTRIRRNQPEPPSRTGGGTNWGTAEGGSGSNAGSSGSGSGVSSGGYSGGGSGGERTAVPRPPGGN